MSPGHIDRSDSKKARKVERWTGTDMSLPFLACPMYSYYSHSPVPTVAVAAVAAHVVTVENGLGLVAGRN